MKKIIVAVLIVAAAAAFTGCMENSAGSSSAASSAKVSKDTTNYDLQKAIRENRQIDENAEVSTFVDQDGNKAFTYKNPDGGGGGGVVMD